jgi:hypothetical protein
MERPLVSRNWVEGVTESVGSNMALAPDSRGTIAVSRNWTLDQTETQFFFEFGIDLDN